MKGLRSPLWILFNLALGLVGGLTLGWGALAASGWVVVLLGFLGALLGAGIGWWSARGEGARRRYVLWGHGALFVLVVVAALIPLYRVGLLPLPLQSREANFERLWRAMDYAYPYFEEKGVDWDALYERYVPQVEQAESDEAYWGVVARLLAELGDGHTGLLSPSVRSGRHYFGTGRVVGDSIVLDRVGQTGQDAGLEREDVLLEVDGMPVEEALDALPLPLRAGSTPQQRRATAAFNVLSTREDTLAVTVSGADGRERSATLVWPGEGAVVTPDSPGPLITTERLDSGVGLIRIPTFEEGEHDLVMEFDAALDGLLDAPALILDLRGNSGGSTHLSDPIAGRLMSRPFTYGREHYPARLPQRGWRPWIDYRVEPRGVTYDGPVVLLIDEGTFSTAENFAVALVDSGRATTVGRQSGGGSGNPISFRLTGGGRARFSTGDFRRNDGSPIEGQGIAPDVPVTWTVEDFRRGRDPDLDAAEALLLSAGEAPEPLDSHALDRFFAEQLRAHAIPGLAVVVVRGEEIVYLRGFGVDGEGLPLTPQSQLQIASLSKSFTALATMQLQEAGQIDLDAPVQAYLPDFTTADPEVGRRITVRQLLNQVSGLSEFGYPYAPPPDADLSTAVADLRRAEPTTLPGSRFAYFNPNYQLLGRIIEVVSGLSYDAYLQANVLGPLGMRRTFATDSQSAALARGANLTRGYLLPFRLPVVAAEPPPVLAPSGGLVSTAEDLGSYLIMQLNEGQYEGERLASAESLRLMQTPPGGEAGYAMGWYVNEEGSPLHIVRHGGSLQTYATSMALLPEEGWGYALLTNHNHALTSLWVMPAMEQALVAHLTGTPLPPSPPSTRALGLLLLVVAGVTVTFALLALVRLPRWAVEAPRLAPYKRLRRLILPWLGLLLLALLPRLFSALFDRAVTHAVLFSLAPGVIGAWGLVALLGVLLGGGRLLGWRRGRSVRGQSGPHSAP